MSGNAALGAGSVSTAALADNAVTLAKMAGGTDGNLIGIDASGDPAYIATGDDGQVLTSGGTGVAALMEASGGGGAWNIIGTAVASSSASLTVTGLDSAYDTYAIAFADIIPATDGVEAIFRVGDSSGVDSGASDYAWFSNGDEVTDTTYGNAGESDEADSGIRIAHDAGGSHNRIGTGTGEGFGGLLYLHRPGDGTMNPMVTGQTVWGSTTSAQITSMKCAGARKSSITLDRVNFLLSSGNIASGRMTVWGIAHA